MIERELLHSLFRRHYSEMLHLARTLLYAEDEAEDAVQDVFLRLMQADIRPTEDKMRAYLFTAVRNQCLNRIRRKSLTERVKGLYSVEMEAERLNDEQRTAALNAVCDCAESRLHEPHITIFRLRFEQGLKLKEIAQQLDMNLKTVYKYLAQAIRQVQKEMKENQS